MYLIHAFYAVFPKIHNATEENKIREVATQHIDLLLECGFTKPASLLGLKDKSELIHAITLHKVILCTLAELEQFRNGMAALGVAESMKQHHEMFTDFYCIGTGDLLTSGLCYNNEFIYGKVTMRFVSDL